MMAGGFFTTAWATDPVNDYVCNKAECYDSVTDTRDYFEFCCYGHYGDSKVYDFDSGNKSNYIGMTNSEMIAATDPTSTDYSVTYIYDNFEWSHCSEDFTTLLSALYDQSKSWNFDPTLAPSPTPTQSFPTQVPTEGEVEVVEEGEPTHKPTRSPDYTHRPTKEPTKEDDEEDDDKDEEEEDEEAEPTHKPTHSPDYTHKPTHSPDYTHRPTHSPDYTHRPTHSPDYENDD